MTSVEEDDSGVGATHDDLVARLCFELGGTLFGIDPESVLEIVDLPEVTRLPKCPPHVLGLVNWRSRPLPLVSFARFVGIAEVERSPEQVRERPERVLVVSAADMTVALRVDRVRSIAKVAPAMAKAHVALSPQLDPYADGQSDLGDEVLVHFALSAFLEKSRLRS